MFSCYATARMASHLTAELKRWPRRLAYVRIEGRRAAAGRGVGAERVAHPLNPLTPLTAHRRAGQSKHNRQFSCLLLKADLYHQTDGQPPFIHESEVRKFWHFEILAASEKGRSASTLPCTSLAMAEKTTIEPSLRFPQRRIGPLRPQRIRAGQKMVVLPIYDQKARSH
jgi:hypothetical protein